MLAGGAAPRVATDDVDTRDVDIRTGRRAATVLAVAGLFVAYVLHAALPASPFTLPGPQTRIVKALVPQGWAFFTKSPRSRSVEVFQYQPDGGRSDGDRAGGGRAGGSWRDITSGPRARPGQLMGLDRLGRSQGTELAMLAAVVPEQSWRDCEREPTVCLAEAGVAHTVRNRSSHQSVCGEVGLVLQDVLPWAWRDAPTTMPSKVLRVRVQC